MTDPMVVASAAVVIIGAVSAATVAIVAAVGRVKKELLAGQAKVEDKTNVIHDLVNGSATAAAGKLTALEAQIANLHAELTAVQQQRVEDAKTSAAADRGRA